MVDMRPTWIGKAGGLLPCVNNLAAQFWPIKHLAIYGGLKVDDEHEDLTSAQRQTERSRCAPHPKDVQRDPEMHPSLDPSMKDVKTVHDLHLDAGQKLAALWPEEGKVDSAHSPDPTARLLGRQALQPPR